MRRKIIVTAAVLAAAALLGLLLYLNHTGAFRDVDCCRFHSKNMLVRLTITDRLMICTEIMYTTVLFPIRLSLITDEISTLTLTDYSIR